MLVLVTVFRWAILAVLFAATEAARHPVAAVALAVPGWGVFAHFSPYRTCRWCRPGGLIGGSALVRLAGYKPKPKPAGTCWRCKRTKLTRRLGAYHAHKVKLSLIQAWEEREWWR